jgi:hypothetical protein
MPQLTFVTVCMGRLAFLKQTLGRMVQQPDCACVVVDYSCPENAGDWAEAHHPQARVLRIPGQQTINVTAARNAGAALVETPWICFIDADIVLDPRFAATVLPQVRPGNFYRADPPSSGIVGTFVCARADFERTGGYDEVFRAYGDDDYDLYDALRFLGIRERHYPAVLVRHLPHEDELRRERFEFTLHGLGNLINRVYRVIKWALARARGRLLTREERVELYNRIFARVSEAFPPERVQPPYPVDRILAVAAGELEQLRGTSVSLAERQAMRDTILYRINPSPH